ncbi:hypothetical protein [Massilia consociata]|uniref:Uncharacterized protein n=1 Tax=Massilia consociata TaxID=760117 RepID=A0ABV6FJM4_9BURK
MKSETSPHSTWHGLPLSPAQNREVLNYIGRCERAGADWDTPELHAMLDDMLHPPELEPEGDDDIAGCTESARFTASHEEPGDTLPEDGRR